MPGLQRRRPSLATASARPRTPGRCIEREPKFTVRAFLETLHYRQPADSERLREGLIKAGLPE